MWDITLSFNTITKKTSLATFFVLSSFFIFLYALIFALFPTVYNHYKIHRADEITTDFINYVESGMSIEESGALIAKNSGYIAVYDENGNKVYQCTETDICYIGSIENLPSVEIGEANVIITDEYFEYEGSEYRVEVVTLLIPLYELRRTLIVLFPYVILIVLIYTLLFSYLNARLLTTPLLKLNRKAREIANLNFDNHEVLDRKDELGELSKNLDIVSNNLKNTLLELQNDLEITSKREKERRIFMATMSHELKTPLTILKGQSECMADNIGRYKDHDLYLRENIKIIDGMEKLVGDILLTSKMDDVEVEINTESFELCKLINQQINNLEIISRAKNIVIEHDLQELFIEADVSITNAVIKNVIENAIKYSDEATVIDVKLKDGILTVKNISSLIKDSHINDLFAPFKTLDESRNSKYGGHGLGMHIIKRGIELNGFTFQANNVGKRVVFMINFNK